jgi:hypothetical protein
MAGRRTQDPRTVMEQMLRNMDRTCEEIAADFETLARNLGERGVTISPRHLRRLASGERVGTTPATRRVLQALFGASVDDLLSPYGLERSGVRRADIRQTDAEVLTMAARRSREFTLSSQVVSGPEAVDRLSDEVREIASTFQREPIPAVLGRLVSAQDAGLRRNAKQGTFRRRSRRLPGLHCRVSLRRATLWTRWLTEPRSAMPWTQRTAVPTYPQAVSDPVSGCSACRSCGRPSP